MEILELIKNTSNDENQMVQRLAKAVTSLRMEDWSSKTISLFIASLENFKNTVETYNQKVDNNTQESNSYKLVFLSATGEEIVKTFEKIECSRKAALLKNDIETSLDEMGQAISEQEKRQVLMEILQKLC